MTFQRCTFITLTGTAAMNVRHFLQPGPTATTPNECGVGVAETIGDASRTGLRDGGVAVRQEHRTTTRLLVMSPWTSDIESLAGRGMVRTGASRCAETAGLAQDEVDVSGDDDCATTLLLPGLTLSSGCRKN